LLHGQENGPARGPAGPIIMPRMVGMSAGARSHDQPRAVNRGQGKKEPLSTLNAERGTRTSSLHNWGSIQVGWMRDAQCIQEGLVPQSVFGGSSVGFRRYRGGSACVPSRFCGFVRYLTEACSRPRKRPCGGTAGPIMGLDSSSEQREGPTTSWAMEGPDCSDPQKKALQRGLAGPPKG
jgi:hypothetical protein